MQTNDRQADRLEHRNRSDFSLLVIGGVCFDGIGVDCSIGSKFRGAATV